VTQQKPAARMGLALAVGLALAAQLGAWQNRIDIVTPAAPELAAFGPHAVGVRTQTVSEANRVDILNTKAEGPVARYTRALALEVWYPAQLAPGQAPEGRYDVITRDPSLRVTLIGRAVRDAAPLASGAPFPLVIISHGYPGNRFLMSHLGENLASKGYVAVSIDHTDSTYDNQQAFASTLYNRPLDQLLVLREMARLSAAASGSYLAGLVDASRTAIVGYSMGGYGVLNTIGGGFSAAAAAMSTAPPQRLLAERGAASPEYRQGIDARVKAAVAIGPWGMQAGYWDAEGLKGIRAPVLLVAGSADEISGYERGTRAIFEGAVNAERYLLTFLNANHNAAAPIPAPAEVLSTNGTTGSASAHAHYADPVWDTTRMNNILQHFVTAHFDRYLKADAAKAAYFDVVPHGREAVYAIDREGKPQPAHTYWKGFKRGTAVGLVLEHRRPGQ
jgi:predicted dienelactone hydrolase